MAQSLKYRYARLKISNIIMFTSVNIFNITRPLTLSQVQLGLNKNVDQLYRGLVCGLPILCQVKSKASNPKPYIIRNMGYTLNTT